MRNTSSGVEDCKGVTEETCGLSPSVKDNAIGITIKGKARRSDNITILASDVVVDHRYRTQDVLEAENSHLKSIQGLNVAGGGGVECLMVNDWGSPEKVVQGGAINKIVSNPIHRFADKCSLKGEALPVKILIELRLESLSLSEGVDLEVDPPGAIRSFANLPIGPKAMDRRQGTSYLLQQVGAWIRGNGWVNRDEYIVNRVAFIPGNNANGDQRI
jgi:hypothetical protein